MDRCRGRYGTNTAVLALVLASIVVGGRSAWGHTPQSPQVQAMIKKGVAFLETYNKVATDVDRQLGGVCICALACYKHLGDVNHPLVQAAVTECRKACVKRVPWTEHNNYSVGIALIFLNELDAGLHRAEIETLLNEMYRRQQSGGGWSYPSYATGDTSQTQYAVLGLWMSHRHGIPARTESVAAVCDWLMRTQSPEGAFGYQGNDPGSYQRVAQERTMPSMGAAGLGSLYVCGELLGLFEHKEKSTGKLPTALRVVEKTDAEPVEVNIDRTVFRTAIQDGNRWFGVNGKTMNPLQQYYYMYAVERYWAFRELAEGRKEAEPAWYNAGINYLRETQAADGSWHAKDIQGPVVDTAFAVLFMLRSAQTTIEQVVEMSGDVRGGKTLPKDLSNIRVNAEGQVVDERESPTMEEMLRLLEDDQGLFDDVPDTLELATDPQARRAQLDRLRRLALSGSYQARMAAVKLLGKDRQLDNVPALIYALSDPDARIAEAALRGLQFQSRKFDGSRFPANPSRQQIQAMQEQWSDWLRSINPDAALIP